MSESESSYEVKLEQALRTAGEWKAKAFKTQKAAETLKQHAEALKARAQLSIEELKVKLEESENERHQVATRLSAVEQQLALFQLAMDEMRADSSTEEILKTIRLAGGITELEEGLSEELRACQGELEICRQELTKLGTEHQATQESHAAAETEWYLLRDEMGATRAVLEDKIGRLEKQNQDLKDTVEELSQFKARGISEVTDRERELQSQLRLVRSQLRAKTRSHKEAEERLRIIEAEAQLRIEELHSDLRAKIKALQDSEARLTVAESDSQVLIEELHNELESTRQELGMIAIEKVDREQDLEAQIDQLEDARSDLEIVNVELYQRISELED